MEEKPNRMREPKRKVERRVGCTYVVSRGPALGLTTVSHPPLLQTCQPWDVLRLAYCFKTRHALGKPSAVEAHVDRAIFLLTFFVFATGEEVRRWMRRAKGTQAQYVHTHVTAPCTILCCRLKTEEPHHCTRRMQSSHLALPIIAMSPHHGRIASNLPRLNVVCYASGLPGAPKGPCYLPLVTPQPARNARQPAPLSHL